MYELFSFFLRKNFVYKRYICVQTLVVFMSCSHIQYSYISYLNIFLFSGRDLELSRQVHFKASIVGNKHVVKLLDWYHDRLNRNFISEFYFFFNILTLPVVTFIINLEPNQENKSKSCVEFTSVKVFFWLIFFRTPDRSYVTTEFHEFVPGMNIYRFVQKNNLDGYGFSENHAKNIIKQLMKAIGLIIDYFKKTAEPYPF